MATFEYFNSDTRRSLTFPLRCYSMKNKIKIERPPKNSQLFAPTRAFLCCLVEPVFALIPVGRGGDDEVSGAALHVEVGQPRDWHVLPAPEVGQRPQVLLQRGGEHPVLSRVQLGLEQEAAGGAEEDGAGNGLGGVAAGPAHRGDLKVSF